MRVTKTVREYIEKKVAEKVYVKYEAEKLKARRQNKEIGDFVEELEDAMNEYVEKHIKMFVEEHPYAERSARNSSVYFYNLIDIVDRHKDSSVHNWQNRARAEIKEKVDDIIVTLELGGNKEDLERMVEAI